MLICSLFSLDYQWNNLPVPKIAFIKTFHYMSPLGRLLTAEEILIVECNLYSYCGNQVGKRKKK